jgi:hypothetical protein
VAKKSTCPHCSQAIDDDSIIKRYLGRKYHVKCYKDMMEAKYEQEKNEETPKEELFKYICQQFSIEEVTPMIRAQIDRLMSENKEWKYSELLSTIKYVVEVEGENLLDNPNIRGVGFLPYKYDLAKNYYLTLDSSIRDIKDQLKSKSVNDFVTNKIIKVKKIDYSVKNPINLEDL